MSSAVYACVLSHVRLCNPMDWVCQSSLSMEFSTGKSTGVGCHFLLQGIFSTQGSNSYLLHWQADSLLMDRYGSPNS